MSGRRSTIGLTCGEYPPLEIAKTFECKILANTCSHHIRIQASELANLLSMRIWVHFSEAKDLIECVQILFLIKDIIMPA